MRKERLEREEVEKFSFTKGNLNTARKSSRQNFDRAKIRVDGRKEIRHRQNPRRKFASSRVGEKWREKKCENT